MLQFISSACGWGYTILWGISWYIPIISNCNLKSVEGLSLDYYIFLGIGYVSYAVSIGTLLYNSTIRSEYAERHTPPNSPLKYPLLNTNDFVFSLHSNLMVCITISQFFFWGFKKNNKGARISRISGTIISSTVFAQILLAWYIYATDEQAGFQYLDLVQFMGTSKVFLSFCKCIPQIIHIHKRKSTHGWPVAMLWTDISGGGLSLVQLFVQGLIKDDLVGVFFNLPKLLLACNAIFFDAIFLFLHYVIYPEKRDYTEIFDEQESFTGLEIVDEEFFKDQSSNKKSGRLD